MYTDRANGGIVGALRLQGFTIGATDGDIGRVDAVYFDDTSFTVRHLVVDTGGWLTGRRVQISPMALPAVDWDGKRINAELTKSQVEQRPDIDTDRRRQKETETTASSNVRLLPRLADHSERRAGRGRQPQSSMRWTVQRTMNPSPFLPSTPFPDEGNPMHSPRRSKMACKHWSLLATIAVATLLYGPSPALAQARLGTAASFAILAGTPAVTNTGPSVVIGNLGIHPAIAVTGFPPGTVIGAIHAGDAVALQAKSDLTTAYVDLAGEFCPATNALGPALDGLTLTPGVYCFTSAALLAVNGTLTLDAEGDPNAEFIFQVGSALTIQSGSTVRLINGGSFCNVFWQVGSSASIGTNADFIGNIVALTSITLDTGADVFGRALARNGTVTLDDNHISSGGCAGAVTIAPPTLAKAFSPATIGVNAVSTLTITLSNANANPATGAAFTDTLPTGVEIAASPNATTDCGGTLTATAGSSTLELTGGTIPAGTTGTPGVCTVTVDVTATTTGSHLNTLPIGALTTSNGDNATEASATLTVPAPGEVTIGKAFSPASITAGGVSTLTITLSNATGSPAIAAFTDNLPSGVLIAATPNATNTCNGTLTATAGSPTLSLTGGTIPAGSPFGTCTVTVDVTAAAAGSYLNTLAGAVATLTVSPAVGHPDPFPSCNLKIEPRSGKAPLTVTLDGCGSHKDGGQIVSYAFDFGDGSSLTTAACSVSHTYTSVGNFTAKLVVTDDIALVSHTCQQGVTTNANKPPVASLKVTPTKVKVGAVVTLDGSGSKDPDGTIASYAFSFGDGTSLTTPGASAFHPYTTIGTFKPCLVVTDNSGAPSNQVCTNVEVIANKAPSANFDSRAAQSPAHTVNFTDTSKDSDGQIVAWAWTFGDGGSSSVKNPSHAYASTGNFTVTLTVTDNNNATSQKIRTIGVK